MKINFCPLESFKSVVNEEVMVMSKDEMNQKSTELIGVLQAISVVAKNLSQRLLKIQEQVNRCEESLSSKSV